MNECERRTMMKKVLALVMVLSMAGFASAALQIDVSGGKATVMGQLDADQFLILSAGDGATLSNFALGAQAPTASYMAAAASDFVGLAPVPDGFAGEGWFLGAYSGEAYKNGAMLAADLALTKSQSIRTWEETVACTQYPNGTLTRTWTEVTDILMGGLSLVSLSANYDNGQVLQTLSIDNRTVSSLTFVDGPCVPEPLTLSLLGLGALVLRRRS
jgi:hypothetical protein